MKVLHAYEIIPRKDKRGLRSNLRCIAHSVACGSPGKTAWEKCLDDPREILLHLRAWTETVNENQFFRVPCRIPLACRATVFCPQLSQNPARHPGETDE